MIIAVVDDERDFTDDMCSLIRSLGHDARPFYDLISARSVLEFLDEPFILLLDHDFGAAHGQMNSGYDLCSILRRSNTFGLLLPIVYLTGRESVAGFIEQLKRTTAPGPSMFISKDQLAKDPAMLPTLLQRIVAEFAAVRDLGEDQAARQALLNFEDSAPEDANET